MNTLIRLLGALVLALGVSACKGTGKPSQEVATTNIESLGCKASQSKMWDSLQRVAEEGQAYPSADEIRSALYEAAKKRALQGEAFDRYVEAFVNNYRVTVQGIREKFGPTNTMAWRQALAEMEVGIRVTEIHAQLGDEITASLKGLAQAEQSLEASCPQPENPRDPAGEIDPQPAPTPLPTTPGGYATIWEQFAATQPAEVWGARRVLATAYQSCDAMNLAPMSDSTPNLQGIVHDSKRNPSNGGILRHYGNLATINSTHYYIHNQRLAGNNCAEVRNHPPIYDFGGKPYTSTSNPTLLNMFRGDGGSGSEVYGLDCSGFVFTALASAGLKMVDPDRTLKANMVLATPAAAFKEPAANHLGCLEKLPIDKNQNLQAGDVVASKTHIIMIDSVGSDPFGLKKATNKANCENLSYIGFDFAVAQSSPSQGDIGINRFKARDYLKTSPTMRSGLEAYAKALCRSRFGAAPNFSSPNMSVVRHKKTPECRTQPFTLTGSDCVASCPAR